ncbi:MAG: PIN domain-containing protein [Armatimonadia bacterium]
MTDPEPVCAVDANVIVRYLVRDDPRHDKAAQDIMRGVSTGKRRLLCDPVILSEVVFVLGSVYHLPRERISEGLTDLLLAPGLLMPGKDLYLRALALFATDVPHFGDACACALAMAECEGRLYSFDRKLSSLNGITRLDKLTR